MFERFKKKTIAIEVASFSDRGLVRPDNQDHLLVNRRNNVFCIADGMGGGEGGAQASEILCDSVAKAVSRRAEFGELVRNVDGAFSVANEAIRKFALDHGYRQMATTAAVLILDSEEGGHAMVGNIGDSRIYRFRNGEMKVLTRDHTMVGELLRKIGANSHFAPEELSRNNSLAHVLTRAVGSEGKVKADWRRTEVKDGDLFLLCTDGVYDMIDFHALRGAFAAGGKSSEIMARLQDLVLSGGAEDNYSMIVLKIRRRS